MSASASNIVPPKVRRRSTEVPVGAICILTAVLATTFAAFMIWAMTVGDFKAEMSQLLSLPWGMVVTLDVYIGLALFSAWMFYREEKSVVAQFGCCSRNKITAGTNNVCVTLYASMSCKICAGSTSGITTLRPPMV